MPTAAIAMILLAQATPPANPALVIPERAVAVCSADDNGVRFQVVGKFYTCRGNPPRLYHIDPP